MVLINVSDDGHEIVRVSGRFAKQLRARADKAGMSPNRLLLRLLTRIAKLCMAATAIRHGQPLSRSVQYYVRQEALSLGVTAEQFINYVRKHPRSHPWGVTRSEVCRGR